jgi:O-antigen/teichoic acid export membrane protein
MNLNTKSFLWLLIEKLARIVSGIFITAAIASHLGPGEFGKLVVALAVVGIFAAGSSMGADHINTAELSRRSPSQSIEYLKSAIIVRLLMALIFVVLFIIYIHISKISGENAYLALLPLIPMAAFAMLGNKIQAEGGFNNFAKIAAIVAIAVKWATGHRQNGSLQLAQAVG